MEFPLFLYKKGWYLAMFKMNVNGKEYTVKFGYFALAKSNSLLEVARVQDRIAEKKKYEKEKEVKEENRKNFPEYDYDEEEGQKNTENIELICEIMNIIPKLLLAGLQKFHKDEFNVDYDSPEDIKEKENEVVEFLDDYYIDDENSLEIMDLFSGLVEELFDNGFLSKKSEKLEAAMTEQNATVTPSDHKQAEN